LETIFGRRPRVANYVLARQRVGLNPKL
jgi:hypothetical protein